MNRFYGKKLSEHYGRSRLTEDERMVEEGCQNRSLSMKRSLDVQDKIMNNFIENYFRNKYRRTAVVNALDNGLSYSF